MKMAIRERKKYACSLCVFSCSYKSDFTIHNRIHTGERPYACQFPGCSSFFIRKSHLVSHSLIHTQDRPFPCSDPQCTHSFRTKSNLKKHMLINLGEKPYKCNLCLRNFRQISALNIHIRTHTGEKPYTCPVPGCLYECADKSSLIRHRLVHSGEKPFKCPVQDCSFSTSQKKSLKQHQVRHLQEKPFECDFKSCHYSCVTSSELRRHWRRHCGDKAKACPIRSSFHKANRIDALFEDPKLRAHPTVLLTDIRKNKPRKSVTTPEKILDNSPVEIQCEISDSIEIEINEEGKENEEPVDKCSEAEAETEVVQVLTRKHGIKYWCKVCDFTSRKMIKYKKHLKEHRERSEFFCSLCDYVCFQRTLMMKHWKTHEEEENSEAHLTEGEITPVSQEIVNTPVNHESLSKNHYPPLKVKEGEQVPSIVTKREFKLYTCVFVSHLNNSPSVYFSCNCCSKQFAKEMEVLNHLRQHTGSVSSK